MPLYISIFFSGMFFGILFTINMCKTLEMGLRPRLENIIHYIFRSESYNRTRIMDNLISTIEWETFNFNTEQGTRCKICGVFENTTNIEIKNIFLEFRFLDEEGVVIKTENNIEYGNTLPGEKRRLSISVYDLEFASFNVIARTNSFADIPYFK